MARLIQRLFFLVILPASPITLLNISAQTSNPEAQLRVNSAAKAEYYVEVNMMKPAKEGTKPEDIRASLRDTAQKKLISSSVTTSPLGNTHFRIPLNLGEDAILKQSSSFEVFVDRYPTSNQELDAEIPVSLDLSIELSKSLSCESPFLANPILVTRSKHSDPNDNDYSQKRLSQLIQFLKENVIATHINITIKPDGKPVEMRNLNSLRIDSASDTTRICIQLTKSVTGGQFDITFAFDSSAPFELRKEFSLKGVNGGPVQTPSTNANTGDVGKRMLEKNLDLSVLFNSSVANATQANQTVRQRTSRGTLDLRFAPLLNWKRFGFTGKGGTIGILTPFYLDTKISSGHITKDTASINRVVLGADYEIRQFHNTHDYPDLFRYIIHVNNTSDRDFKQVQGYVGFEFQPLFGKVNKPINSAPDLEGNKIVYKGRWGYEVTPIVGVEFGRTYHVADTKSLNGASQNLRHFYFGSNITLSLTKYVKVSATDKFYVRGESVNDRGHNYFLGSVEAPLANISDTVAHGLFFSFERGSLPPYSTPDVNTVKFGYRIIANPGWFGGRR